MKFLVDQVGSLSEFVEWVKNVQDSFVTKRGNLHEPWFRGVSDARYHLVPGLYRAIDRANSAQAEDALRRGFERRAPKYLGDSLGNDVWDFYFLMQHYRVPTRLLDWTDSALVALYFAVYSAAPDSDAVPAVWSINPFALNKLSVGNGAILASNWKLAKPYLRTGTSKHTLPSKELPAGISPRLFDRRMLAQHSQFTIHGSKTEGIDQMAELSSLADAKWLRKAIIKPVDGLPELKLHMATCGIVHTMAFPDLEGLSKDLQRDYLSL